MPDDDPFRNTQPQSKRMNPRRFPALAFAAQFFVFWLSSMNVAWHGPNMSVWPQIILAVGFGLVIVLQIQRWTKQVEKDVEKLEEQIRGLSATVIQQAAALNEWRKEQPA